MRDSFQIRNIRNTRFNGKDIKTFEVWEVQASAYVYVVTLRAHRDDSIEDMEEAARDYLYKAND